MSNKHLLAKAFGVAAFGVVGVTYMLHDENSEKINVSLALLSNAALSRTVEFNRQIVSAEGFNPSNPNQSTPSAITYDVLERKLCHSNLTGDDQSVPVCHSDSELDEFQHKDLRSIICHVAERKHDKAYKQLFCGPQPKQV